VDVRVLVPERSNHVVADWLARGHYATLLRGGVRIFLYTGAMIHAKTATIDGRWSILLDRTDGGHADGETARAAAERPLRSWRSHEVTVEDGDDTRIVRVDGQAVPLRIVDRRARAGGRAGAPAGAAGPRVVVAPMPGRIVKVLVAPGDVVAARQGVVIVEAMKMENELRAPRAGTVAAVHVTEGMSVDARAVLVVLE